MMNMSYCRLENTLAALRECADYMMDNCDPINELSDSEKEAARKLIELCALLAAEFDVP